MTKYTNNQEFLFDDVFDIEASNYEVSVLTYFDFIADLPSYCSTFN